MRPQWNGCVHSGTKQRTDREDHARAKVSLGS